LARAKRTEKFWEYVFAENRRLPHERSSSIPVDENMAQDVRACNQCKLRVFSLTHEPRKMPYILT